MDKREQELRQKVADLKEEAQNLMNDKKQDDAKAKLADAKAAKAELDNYLDMKQIEVPEPENKGGKQMNQEPKDKKDDKLNYTSVFLKALRKKPLNDAEMAVMDEFKAAAMVEGVDADGGYIVPEDISTKINELKNTVDNLEQYVTVEPVSTNKGARTLEVKADSTPFSVMDEMGNPTAMEELSGPKFSRISYAIKDYAGFLPISNDLLNDTDQNLVAYLRRWFAKKSKATRNNLIINLLKGLTAQAISTTDAIKDLKQILNVDLDPAHAQNAVILTNQDGFNYLDQLEDADGRGLLQPDPTNATRKLAFGKPVVVVSNKTIASRVDGVAGTTSYPFFVGDLKEAVVLFDRKQMSLDMTKEGGSAWRTNSTEIRAIEREDIKLWDSEAVVFGEVTV